MIAEAYLLVLVLNSAPEHRLVFANTDSMPRIFRTLRECEEVLTEQTKVFDADPRLAERIVDKDGTVTINRMYRNGCVPIEEVSKFSGNTI